jgi:hypothetical protein
MQFDILRRMLGKLATPSGYPPGALVLLTC